MREHKVSQQQNNVSVSIRLGTNQGLMIKALQLHHIAKVLPRGRRQEHICRKLECCLLQLANTGSLWLPLKRNHSEQSINWLQEVFNQSTPEKTMQ